MARLPRLIIPGQLHLIMQRGNNGSAIFSGPPDYLRMLDILYAHSQKLDGAIHAYVLLENQFWLLATPQAADSLQEFIQSVGRSYVRYFNDATGRTGTLWDGRYRCTLLQAEKYLLPCMAFMDLRPVRAGLVPHAADYVYSSHRHYIGRQVDRLVRPHALYWALDNTPFAREARYGEWVAGEMDADLESVLMQSAYKGWALGDAEFVADMQKVTPRRLSRLSAGRPARAGSADT